MESCLKHRPCVVHFVMAAVETRRLSRGELVDIASQEAVKTYLAELPKEVVETVDTALLVNESVLPVHQFVLISSSAVLRDLLSSPASTMQEHQVQMVPLVDDKQDCVQDALTYMYKHVILSTASPGLASITQAKHSAQFGHKYGVQVLLDDSDAFINRWCKVHLFAPYSGKGSRFP